MSSTRPHAKGPEAKTRSLSDAHDVTTALLVSLFLCGVCIVCLQSVCSVLFSFLTGSLGLNVLIVKIRFEFVFNCCEKRISAFDSWLGKYGGLFGHISSRKASDFERNLDLKIRGEQQPMTSLSLSSWHCRLSASTHIEFSNRDFFQNRKLSW